MTKRNGEAEKGYKTNRNRCSFVTTKGEKIKTHLPWVEPELRAHLD